MKVIKRFNHRGAIAEQPAGGSWKKKPVIISILTAVIVVVLVAVLFTQRLPTAGQAIHIQTGASTGGQVYINFQALTAAQASTNYPADVVPVEVMINIDDSLFSGGTSPYTLTALSFQVDFPPGLELVPNSGGKYLQVDNNFNALTKDDQPFQKNTKLDFMHLGFTGNKRAVTFFLKPESGATEDTPLLVEIKSIVIEGIDANNIQIFNSGITHNTESTATITIVPGCQDNDKDGYGAQGTDLRGCPQKGPQEGNLNFDCVDAVVGLLSVSGNLIYPGRPEVCNGVDDNCNSQTDESLTGAANSNTQGVCWGTQICRGTARFVDSYLVSVADVGLVGLTPVTFTDQKGEVHNQQELYSSSGELCDFFDNDCDGAVNEGIACDLGEPSIVGLPPGNIYVDYSKTDNKVIKNQLLDEKDIFLVEQMIDVLDSGTTCGSTGQAPCFREVGGVFTWICKNGVFYQYDSPGPQEEKQTFKFSPTSKELIVVNNVIPVGEVLPDITCQEE